MNNEYKGKNTELLFRKNPRLIFETKANIIQSKYKTQSVAIFLRNNATVNKIKKAKTFIRGSTDCNNPRLAAYSSENTDSFKKDTTPIIECSIKLFLIFASQKPAQKKYQDGHYDYPDGRRKYIAKPTLRFITRKKSGPHLGRQIPLSPSRTCLKEPRQDNT
jgi:hypothetical protein